MPSRMAIGFKCQIKAAYSPVYQQLSTSFAISVVAGYVHLALRPVLGFFVIGKYADVGIDE